MTGAGWSAGLEQLESAAVPLPTPTVSPSARRGERASCVFLPNERGPNDVGPRGVAVRHLPDSKSEQPPVIRRAEVVAFALVALLVSVRSPFLRAKAFFCRS